MPVFRTVKQPLNVRISPVYHPFFTVYFLPSVSEKNARIHRLNGGNGEALGSQKSRKQLAKMVNRWPSNSYSVLSPMLSKHANKW
jgi:hypothetical protein